MPRALVCILLSLIYFTSPGQNQRLIDSLKKQAVNTNDVLYRYNLFNTIAFRYRLTHPDSSIFYGEEAYKLGSQSGVRDLGRPLNIMALANRNLGDYRESFRLLEQAVSISKAQGDSVQLAFALNNQGLLMMDNGEIKQAYNLLIEARLLFERFDYQPGLAEVYSSLSDFYRIQDDFENAIRFKITSNTFRKSIRNDEHAVINALLEIGGLYELLNDTVQTRLYFDRADSLSRELNDPFTQLEISIAHAKFLIKYNRIEEAESIIVPVYLASSKSKNMRMANELLYIKGLIATADGRLSEALQDFQLLVTQSGIDLIKLRDTYRQLSIVLNKLGRRQEAVKMENQYHILQDSIENIDLARKIDRLSFQLEIEKKDRDYRELQLDEASNRANLESQKNETRMLIGVIILTSVFLLVQIYNTLKMKKANQRLSEQNAEIEKQEAAIKNKNAMLSNHNRLLSEMNHEKDVLMGIMVGDLKSSLETIQQSVNMIAESGNEKNIELTQRKAGRALQLINDILLVENMQDSIQVHEEKVVIEDLLDIVNNHFVNEAERKGIKLDFQKSSNSHYVRTDAKHLTVILTNLLSNAIRFSPSGTKVTLDYGVTQLDWFVRVTDEGPGFTEEDHENLYQKFRKLSAQPTEEGDSGHGLGLTIVKLLVDTLKGDISLSSTPGKGSEFTIIFKLR